MVLRLSMEWEQIDAATLFQACAGHSHQQAWTEFVRRFGKVISRTAYRVAHGWATPDPSMLDDLVQEVYLKLCAHDGRALREFRPLREGSEFGFLRVLTANVVMDHFKKLNSVEHGGREPTVPLESAPGPALADTTIEREITLREVQEELDRITEGSTGSRDRWIFALYYRQGFTARHIAALPAIGLTCEGVESVLGKLTKALRRRLAPKVGRGGSIQTGTGGGSA